MPRATIYWTQRFPLSSLSPATRAGRGSAVVLGSWDVAVRGRIGRIATGPSRRPPALNRGPSILSCLRGGRAFACGAFWRGHCTRLTKRGLIWCEGSHSGSSNAGGCIRLLSNARRISRVRSRWWSFQKPYVFSTYSAPLNVPFVDV